MPSSRKLRQTYVVGIEKMVTESAESACIHAHMYSAHTNGTARIKPQTENNL